MLSEKAPEPSPTPGGEPTANPTDGVSSGGGVKTGDESLPIWIWLVIAVAAAVCLVCLGRKLLKDSKTLYRTERAPREPVKPACRLDKCGCACNTESEEKKQRGKSHMKKRVLC